jgi:hypothetical protein
MVALTIVNFLVSFPLFWVFMFFMQQRIISWNVRGLNNPQKRERVKFWLRHWKGDIVCLQETKLDFLDRRIVRSL